MPPVWNPLLDRASFDLPDPEVRERVEAARAVAANQAAAQRFIAGPALLAAALDALHASSVAAARTGAERRVAALGLDPACLPHRQGRV